MAHEFPELPENIYKYENQFDYSVWTPNTEVTCAAVPWDASYRDIVRFESEELRKRYFDEVRQYGYSFTIGGMTYLRYGEPVRVNAPFSMVNQCNYLIVRNPVQPVPSTASGYGVPERKPDTFYYFITDIKYIAPNTTQLNVQLDVWQTYYDRISFGLCYVNKGHIGIANENATLDNLSEYLLEPEGLDIGGEYDIVDQDFTTFLDEPPVICILSGADLTADLGTVSKPNLVTSRGGFASNLPCGSSFMAIDASDFDDFMINIADAPWAAQCIQLITAVPRRFVNLVEQGTIAGVRAYDIGTDNAGFQVNLGDFRTRFGVGGRYRNLKKFLTYPYTVMEATTFTGGEMVLKPECVGANELLFNVTSCINPSTMRTYVYPHAYNRPKNGDRHIDMRYYPPNGSNDSEQISIEQGDNLDAAICISNFPQFSLVTNSYITYLASNRNALNYAYQSADWSQQKAMTAAQLAYNQSTNAMDTAWANQLVANQANWGLSGISQEKNAWGGVQGMMTSALGAGGNLASGNFGGAVADVMNVGLAYGNAALNQDWINRTTATQVGAATASTQNNLANQAYNRDTNYDYAAFAAKGDYENAIAGIQAKVQDAKLLQPATAGQNGGDGFNMATGFMGLMVRWKRIKPGAMRQIGDFWLRYGYYVNRWVRPPQDLRCMENFTYWKMQQVQINATMPETFKQAIRGILEKGVTVWSSPSKINNIELDDNEPLEGVRY